MHVHTLSTVAASVLFLALATLNWFISNKTWRRLTVVFVLGAAGGLVGTVVGRWLHNGLGAFYDWTAHYTGPLVGATVGTIAGCVATGLAIIVGHHVHQKKVDDKTLIAAAAIPWAAPFAPGIVGTVIAAIVSAAAAFIGALGAMLFHL